MAQASTWAAAGPLPGLPPLDEASARAAHRLADELAELPASEIDRALDVTLGRIGTLIGSRHGYRMSCMRFDVLATDDALPVWRVRDGDRLGTRAADECVYRTQAPLLDNGDVTEAAHRLVRRSAPFYATLIADLVLEA